MKANACAPPRSGRQPELQSCILRFAVSSVIDINEPEYGMYTMGMALTLRDDRFQPRRHTPDCTRGAPDPRAETAALLHATWR